MADDIRIVPALGRHVATIARRMREVDRRECLAFGQDGKAALRHGLAHSAFACTATVGGRPEAMFGLVLRCALTGEGTPWFLGTDAVHRHPRVLLREGRRILSIMRATAPRLSNLVSVENRAAIRLLRRWGFTLETEKKMMGEEAFVRFWLGGQA